MDKNLDPELIKNLLTIYRNSIDQKPYILKVSHGRVTKCGNEDIESGTYDICSACYSLIEKTWDHADWCELYKPEALSDWLKKGKNEK